MEHLSELDVLITEFFDTSTSNARKKEIESLLESFSFKENAWNDCFIFITNTSNQYVCMFALHTLENIICQRWIGMDGSKRSEIRNNLNSFLMDHHRTAPRFIRNKLIKLLVIIAKSDWPHFYPNFFHHIFELLKSKEHRLLGLECLLITSEELSEPKDRVTYARKDELKRLMNNEVESILKILNEILDSSSSNSSEELLSSLHCLSHLLSWIPMSSLRPKLMYSLFSIATLGVSESDSEIPLVAMEALNEILGKTLVTPEFESFLFQLFKMAFTWLENQKWKILSSSYVNKFNEFLFHFVHRHLRPTLKNPEFSLPNFLNLLFTITFSCSSVDLYISFLSLWKVIIERVQHSGSSEDFKGVMNSALMTLSSRILQKIQFKSNEGELNDLNTSFLDDDNESEWSLFLRHSIETLMKVAQVIPEEIFRLIDSGWKEHLSLYSELVNYVVDSKLILPHESDYTKLHFALRDLSSLLILQGRLSTYYLGDETFHRKKTEGLLIFQQIIDLTFHSSNVNFYNLSLPSQILTNDFVDVYAQALAALKAWCPWLSALQSEKPEALEFKDYFSKAVLSIRPLFKDPTPKNKLIHSAVHFLVSLTGTVRPVAIWKLKEFTELFHDVTHTLKLESLSRRLLVRALSNVLLFHWPGMAEQRWKERESHLNKFLTNVTEAYLNLVNSSSSSILHYNEDSKTIIIENLLLLSDLVENVSNEVFQTKKLLLDCIRRHIDISLNLFSVFEFELPILESLFSFFHVIFDVLQAQLGISCVQNILFTFFGLFNRERLRGSLLESELGVISVEKFLGILNFVVKEPRIEFRKLLPEILSLVLDELYPLVSSKSTSEIKGVLYELLLNVVLYNWKYFFKSSVVRTLGEPKGSDQVQNQSQFLNICQAFGESFLQADVSIFKQNLKALEQINEKWKLYHKPIFTETLITQFLTVFLQSLIHRSHELLQEEIICTIYSMSSVNFEGFFSQFLPSFISNMNGLDAHQRNLLQEHFKMDLDFPSFSFNVNRFTNDLRYYRLCNASLHSDNSFRI